MKKKLPTLLVFVIIIACQQVSKKEKDITMDTIAKQEINKIILDTIDETMMLLGNINKEGLNGDDFIEWYQENYKAHQLDTLTIKEINKEIHESFKNLYGMLFFQLSNNFL